MPKLRSLIISVFKLMQLLVKGLNVYSGNSSSSEGSGAEGDKITPGARLSCLTPVALSAKPSGIWKEEGFKMCTVS